MAKNDLGKVAITPGGTWNATDSYERLTTVIYDPDGCGYIALRDNIGVTPGTDATVWSKYVKAGKSIYELCVQAGYTGTEEEFIAEYNAAVAAANTAASTANTKMAEFQQAETSRGTAEAARVTAESSRATAETSRAAAEGVRAAAEVLRNSAEQAREDASATAVAAANTAAGTADTAATLANTKAGVAQTAATAADTAAANANAKAAIAQAAADACAAYDTRISQNATDIAALKGVTEKLEAKDLSHYGIDGEFHHLRTTANCYVCKEAGVYRLPLVYGNALKDGSANSAAYTNAGGTNQADFVNHLGNKITGPYIEEHAGCQASSAVLVWADADNLISDLKLVNGSGCRDLLFKLNSVPTVGANAVLAIKDANGNVIWSWHIWAIADDLTPVTLTNHTEVEYDVLPLNLGWTWDSADKLKGKNVFYQWGRKDPMPSPAAYNSSSDHALYGTMTFQKVAAAEGIADGILNPNKFYIQDENNNNDWQSGITARYNHWDASCAAAGASDNVVVKTVYDPSPVGYKMPNARLFTGFTTTGGNTSTPEEFNVIDAFANGWKFKKNGEDLDGEFFAASGSRNRSSGGLLYVGSYGYYWSSAVGSAANAYRLHFNSGNVNPLNDSNRASGFAVRPVRESN